MTGVWCKLTLRILQVGLLNFWHKNYYFFVYIIAPAVAGTVSVWTVDACGQKSVEEVDLSLVTTLNESCPCGHGNNGTLLKLAGSNNV